VTAARFEPCGPLRGSITPPPDKSISHRAAILAAMADGESVIRNYLDAADTRSTVEAMQALGANVEWSSGDLRIQGVGVRGPGPAEIDVGNAGTLLRLLPGWLAGQPKGTWTLDGDSSIRRRPIDRISNPLGRMGAQIGLRDGRFAPVTIEGGSLRGIEYELPVASAQVKSCILLAGLLAEDETTVIEPLRTRDHTERMLARLGADIGTAAGRITIRPAEALDAGNWEIPGDFSSAAFLIVAALLVPGSELRIQEVGLNPTRAGLLRVLNRMGAEFQVGEERGSRAEPFGSLVVRQGGLTGTSVGADQVPAMIDELPLMALLGCFAEGETRVTGAEELRVKESDRIAAVVDGLRGLGADIEALQDGFVVRGTGGIRGGTIASHGDHRLAMLGAVAGLASGEGVEVHGFDAAAVSYPGFESDLRSLLG
jgi:3-phosphoshikimate 1-carboxyvinyltransferase